MNPKASHMPKKVAKPIETVNQAALVERLKPPYHNIENRRQNSS